MSWATLGADALEAQAATDRPWFAAELGPALARVPEIADVGCGEGWSTVALARSYPETSVTGIDVDRSACRMACRRALVGPGMVMRPTRAWRRTRSRSAGVDVLPIEDFAFFRFYRLR